MGGEKLKLRQLAHNQLMRPQGPHFSPHSTAKMKDKRTNIRKKWYLLVKCCSDCYILLEKPSEEVDEDYY